MQKSAFFVHCSVSECLANQQATVLELSHSVAVFELNRTIWQDFIAFLWFILPGATFLVTSSILLNWNKENLLLNHTYAYRMCGIDPYSMLLNYLLTKLEGRAQWPKIADSWTSLDEPTKIWPHNKKIYFLGTRYFLKRAGKKLMFLKGWIRTEKNSIIIKNVISFEKG